MTTPAPEGAYHCPNCNHFLFNYRPTQATAEPAGDTGKDGAVCPKCSGPKSPGFDLCFNCNQENLDTCPQCGGNKRKQFPTCYNCSQQSGDAKGDQGAPAQAGNAFVATVDEDDDEPF